MSEKHESTDQEIKALSVEGYMQEALTKVAAWITKESILEKKFG
jgi:hypothetical protein